MAQYLTVLGHQQAQQITQVFFKVSLDDDVSCWSFKMDEISRNLVALCVNFVLNTMWSVTDMSQYYLVIKNTLGQIFTHRTPFTHMD